MGPVQLLVLEIDGEPRGELLAELDRLEGVVRLVDFIAVRRKGDHFEPVEVPGRDAGEGEGDAVRALLGGEGDGEVRDVGEADVWYLADQIPDNSVVAIALIEHVWAESLRAASQGAGAVLLAEEWLHPDDLTAAGIA